MTQGQMLREARNQKKLRLVDLAEKVGVSASFLSQLERGVCKDVSAVNAQKIIEALDLTENFFGGSIVGEKSDWERFLDEYDLPREHQAVLKKTAEAVPVYRGEAVAERNTMVWYEKSYKNMKPYLPPIEKQRLEDPVVLEMLQAAGIEAREELSAILDEIETRFSPDGIKDAKERGTRICKERGVVIKRLRDEDKEPNYVEDVKRWCAERGLYNVIGELFLYDESPGLFGGAYPIHGNQNPKEKFLIISDLRGLKELREEFTFWHELSHIIMDPELKQAPARRGGGVNVKEWFLDHVAARLAFPKKIFQPIVRRICEENKGALPTMELVGRIKDEHAHLASRQMVARMIVNYWPEPLVYLEAALQLKKNERDGLKDDDHLSPLAKLRVNLVQANGFAKETMPDIPRNFRIPEDSIVFAAYKAFPEQTVFGPQKESFSRWTSSTGQSLGDGDYWVSACAEPDQDTLNSQAQRIRAYAFLTTNKYQ